MGAAEGKSIVDVRKEELAAVSAIGKYSVSLCRVTHNRGNGA